MDVREGGHFVQPEEAGGKADDEEGGGVVEGAARDFCVGEVEVVPFGDAPAGCGYGVRRGGGSGRDGGVVHVRVRVGIGWAFGGLGFPGEDSAVTAHGVDLCKVAQMISVTNKQNVRRTHRPRVARKVCSHHGLLVARERFRPEPLNRMQGKKPRRHIPTRRDKAPTAGPPSPPISPQHLQL